MSENTYLAALRDIPAGETRSFHELAAMAGKPAAARAAGRAIAACPENETCPWQRVVAADGSLAREPDRARVQLERLRREGARPRDGESIARWAGRRRAGWIGDWRTRSFAAKDDPRVSSWAPERVEAFRSTENAVERGFKPAREARTESRPRGRRDSRAPEAESSGDRAPRSSRRESKPSRLESKPLRRESKPSSRESKPSRREPSPSRLEPRPLRLEPSSAAVEERLERVDWQRVRDELGARGAATVPHLFDAERCRALRDLFDASELFERTIDMGPRGYGVGTYRYFKEPLPEPAYSLRDALYARLLELARGARRPELARGARRPELARGARSGPEYPSTLAEFFEQCRAAGQRRSSSILLSYSAGGVNHPHRDIYGKLWFPYQAVLVLSAREEEFEGGDLLLCTRASDGSEERRALPLDRGDLCVFASRGFETAVPGDRSAAFEVRPGKKNGTAAARRSSSPAAKQREKRWVEQTHGLTTVTRGARFALGIVLHLAQ